MRTVSVALLVIPVLLGCHVGQNAESYPVANSGHGVQTSLRIGHTPMVGELLAVRDSALLVLHSGEVLLVPFRAIAEASFAKSDIELSHGRAPTSGQSEFLRLISRFPQGVSPELERRLLAAYGQKTLAVAGP